MEKDDCGNKRSWCRRRKGEEGVLNADMCGNLDVNRSLNINLKPTIDIKPNTF